MIKAPQKVKMIRFMAAALFVIALLVACGTAPQVTETRVPQVVESITPTLALTPTATLTPLPTSTPTITPTPVGGGRGKILFLSERDNKDYSEAYVMNSDGSNQIRLTHNGYVDEIQWSPDGTKVLFFSVLDRQIYVINSDGSYQTRLTSLGRNNNPKWSPDGKKIVFVSNRDLDLDADYFRNYSYDTALLLGDEIYVMNADGSNLTRLTNNQRQDGLPEWSPDGTKIAFWSYSPDTGSNIYVMNADGNEQFQATNNHRYNLYPKWSPDSKKIAFISKYYNEGFYDIYVVDWNGKNENRLTRGKGSFGDHEWSPDGQMLAFSYSYGSNDQICIINTDSSERRTEITDALSDNEHPRWSPDGKKIAFISDRDGQPEIYIMNTDGSEQTRLTNSPFDEGWLWQFQFSP